MTSGSTPQTGTVLRCAALWLVTGTVLAATLTWLGGDVWSLVDPTTWRGPFDRLLVAVSAAAVVLCLGWFWAVTTLTAGEMLAGAAPADLARRGGTTRRLVLAICGAAALVQLTQPALAVEQAPGPRGDPPAGAARLAGLSLPDRATRDQLASDVREVAPRARRPAPGSVVVAPGDSLWAIAEQSLVERGRAAPSAGAIDAYWRQIDAVNRAVVGADPDLIHPGQRLQVPDPATEQPEEQ